MIFPAGRFLTIVNQVPEKGSAWEVRVYKKVFIFKKLISCDWFLDEQQAKGFAKELAEDLQGSGSANSLKSLMQRKPGWTLRQPAH